MSIEAVETCGVALHTSGFNTIQFIVPAQVSFSVKGFRAASDATAGADVMLNGPGIIIDGTTHGSINFNVFGSTGGFQGSGQLMPGTYELRCAAAFDPTTAHNDSYARVWAVMGFPSFCIADVAQLGGEPGPDAQLSADDLIVFLNAFFAGNRPIADVVSLGGAMGPDGDLTADDVIAFLTAFFAGCV